MITFLKGNFGGILYFHKNNNMSSPRLGIWSVIRQSVAGILIYFFLILCLGYEYGSGDQVEFIPLMRDNLSHGYFDRDFFVQNYLHAGHDIRQGMIWLCDLGDAFFDQQWYFWVLHFFFTMVSVFGALRLISVFSSNLAVRIAVVGIVWGLMYGINLGGNEVYYPQLLPSLVAKSFLIWALVAFVRKKDFVWPVLVLAGSVFQDMAALQMLILLPGTIVLLFLSKYFSGRSSGDRLLSQANILQVIAFIGVLAVFIYLKRDLFTPGDNEKDSHFLIDVLLWRVAHHFDPASFGLRNFLVFSLFIPPALWLIRAKSQRLFFLVILILAGCIVYASVFQFVPSIILTQWFKTTIWLKLICFSSVLCLFLDVMVNWNKKNKINTQTAVLTACLILGIFKGPLDHVSYQLPFTLWEKNDEILIAQQARQKSPEDALFVIPPDNTTFKIWGRRSCYVDYKSTVFDAGVLRQWMHRLDEVYSIGPGDPGGFLAYPAMRSGYNTFLNNPENLKKRQISHFISEDIFSQYRLLAEQGRWRLYAVR